MRIRRPIISIITKLNIILIISSQAFCGDKFSIWIFLDENVYEAEFRSNLPDYVHLRYFSPALHAVSLSAESDSLSKLIPQLQSLGGVAEIRKMGYLSPPEPVEVSGSGLAKTAQDPDYGTAWHQLDMLGIPALHSLGYRGEGVRVGLLDQGFNKDLEGFRHILEDGRLIGEYDFVYGDSLTKDEDDEWTRGLAMIHGNGTWSAIAAELPGLMLGGASKAEFAIAKTEDMLAERPVEEDNYVAAIEWMDSLGIDVVSVSLNYYDFDGTADDYFPSDLDGQTTVVARICNWAASRGMIIVQSMGNEGPAPSSLWSPADAPSVISVGAVLPDGQLADFSSRGPTADGRIKPDITAMGVDVVLMDETGAGIRYGDGTSFATPLIASGVILLKQIHPEWTLEDILNAFARFSDNLVKDNGRGWGIPDFSRIILESSVSVVSDLLVYPNPTDRYLGVQWNGSGPGAVSLTVYDILGRTVLNRSSSSTVNDFNTVLDLNDLPLGVYFIEVGEKHVKCVKLP